MPASNIQISVVVPVYNSASTLHELVEDIQQALFKLSVPFEILLTDDASTDHSWQEISLICQSNPKIIGIRLRENSGQWKSTLAGMSCSTGKYIVTIDDDLEYDPQDVIQLYEYIKRTPFKVVFGIAEKKYELQGKSKTLSTWRNKILNSFWQKAPTDSFKILERQVVFQHDKFLPTLHFEAFINHNLDKKLWGYRPVNFRKRKSGLSNHSIYKKVYLFMIYTIHYFRKQSPPPNYSISEMINLNVST